MLTHRISLITGILLASSLCPALVQGQAAPAPSVADAARKARQGNQSRPPAKVITNEDIGDLKGTISVVGTPPAAAASADEAAAAGTAAPGTAAAPAAAPKAEANGEAYWRAKFADARRKLADDTKEADVLQREYNLKQQQFYSDPNVALREQNNRADLNKTLDQINTKKADVEKDQQAVSTLEDDLRKAGGDPGWSRQPTP